VDRFRTNRKAGEQGVRELIGSVAVKTEKYRVQGWTRVSGTDPMSLQTFSASTMAEALLQVKRAFGRDAVILHTRTVMRRHWMGLRKRELVEVTAGPEGSAGIDRRRPMREGTREQSNRGVRAGAAAAVPAGRGINTAAGAYSRNSMPGKAAAVNASRPSGAVNAARISAALGTSLGASPAAVPAAGGTAGGRKSFFDSPEMTQAMVRLVTEEVTGLRSELKELVTHVRKGGTNSASGSGAGRSVSLPAELYQHYQQLIENQVAEELAEDILKAVKIQVPAGYLSNEAFVREK